MASEMDDYLLTKDQLAERLGLKRRGVECLIAARKIPVIKISGRCVRFSWPRVQAALNKFEVAAIGTK
jgi:excisionase family DNA binding protein